MIVRNLSCVSFIFHFPRQTHPRPTLTEASVLDVTFRINCVIEVVRSEAEHDIFFKPVLSHRDWCQVNAFEN